jgi:hypothetical protein
MPSCTSADVEDAEAGLKKGRRAVVDADDAGLEAGADLGDGVTVNEDFLGDTVGPGEDA